MRWWKGIFTFLVVFFAIIGFCGVMPYNISNPLMLFFMGLVLLTIAKEYYNQGQKKHTAIFVGTTIVIYIIILCKFILELF